MAISLDFSCFVPWFSKFLYWFVNNMLGHNEFLIQMQERPDKVGRRKKHLVIVEILSPSTEKYDRNEKFVDYAAHGVQEYWIIEPEIEIVEQYFNEGGKFVLFQKLHKGLLESKTVSGFAIDLKDIFH